jgi:ABC-type polysaccharide/polyol phosphate export permease
VNAAVPAVARAKRRPAVVLVLGGVAAVGVVGGAVLAFPAASRVGLAQLYLTDLAIGASFTTIGVLVTQRRPDNPIGWLFLAIGVVEGLVAGLNHYAIVGLAESSFLPGAMWATWFAYWAVSLVVPSGLFLLLLLLFPSGRPISPAWGWVAGAGLAFSVLLALTEILLTARMEITPGLEIDNPTNIASIEALEQTWIVGLAILLIGVAGVVVRYRRAGGEERQQLRWFMFAVAAAIGTMALVVLIYVLAGAPEPEPTWFLVTTSVLPLVGIGVGVPAACGIAILRYRLWDLDIVIRKAVLAAVVVAAISVVYIGIVGGLGAIVGSRLDTTLGFAAAAILAVAFGDGLAPAAALWGPVLILIELPLAIGLVLLGSALNVFARDVRLAVPLLVQFWLFLTPVLYELHEAPESLRQVFMANPMTGLVVSFRRALLFGEAPSLAILWPTLLSAALAFLVGWWYFASTERRFADVI